MMTLAIVDTMCIRVGGKFGFRGLSMMILAIVNSIMCIRVGDQFECRGLSMTPLRIADPI